MKNKYAMEITSVCLMTWAFPHIWVIFWPACDIENVNDRATVMELHRPFSMNLDLAPILSRALTPASEAEWALLAHFICASSLRRVTFCPSPLVLLDFVTKNVIETMRLSIFDSMGVSWTLGFGVLHEAWLRMVFILLTVRTFDWKENVFFYTPSVHKYMTSLIKFFCLI